MKLAVSKCWVDPAYPPNTRGYFCSKAEGKQFYAHRLAYETLVGPIPEGLGLDHVCRNRACFNPAHLEPVTSRENTLRGALYRGGFCRKCGTELNDNTAYRVKDRTMVGGFFWQCRSCLLAYQKQWKERKRALATSVHELTQQVNEGRD